MTCIKCIKKSFSITKKLELLIKSKKGKEGREGIIGKYGMRDHELEDEMRRIYWNPLSTKPMVSKSKSVLDEVSAQYEFPGLQREFPFYKPACEHLKPKNLASIFGFETMHLFLLGAPKRAFEYIYELFSVKDDEKKGMLRREDDS